MKSYAFVGVGGRAAVFYEAICSQYKNSSQIAGICDLNPGRLKRALATIQPFFPDCHGYQASEFDAMISETKPDVVFICSIDKTHDDYICRALEAGCDVITEKPMTIDNQRCQRIIDMVKKTGRQVRVAFNYRYSPARAQVKELLMQGAIGKVHSVTFQWNLDTHHGADYFRRWHRKKENSGGLLVHKSTHHFDLVNWWLGDVPMSVFAAGQRSFYTAQQAERYGLAGHGQRCLDCVLKSKCNFYLNIAAVGNLNELYLQNEKYDGYYRDRCIFNEDTDIEDTYSVVVRYEGGAILNYSLNAFQPWEGYRIEFNGSKGRLEHTCRESSYINGDGTIQGQSVDSGTRIHIYPHFKRSYEVPVRKGEGGHGGGDMLLIRDLFGAPCEDPLKCSADYVQGAYSILVGIAANQSIGTGQNISIARMVCSLPRPDYPQNDTADELIEYVEDSKYWHEMAMEQ